MKTRMHKILSLLLCLSIICAMAPTSQAEELYEDVVQAKLADVLARFPHGTYWNSSFDGGSQCYGFAKMVIYEVFGRYSSSKYRSWLYNGTSTSGMNKIDTVTDCTEGNVQALLQKARPGDVLQFDQGSNGHQHSMIVYAVTSTGAQIYECNMYQPGGKNNQVTLTSLTNAEIAKRKTSGDGSKRGNLYLLRSDNYLEAPSYVQSYLNQCTNETCNVVLKITTAGNMNIMPCSKQTNPQAETVETLTVGDTYSSSVRWINPEGSTWYEVRSKAGNRRGFIYAGDASVSMPSSTLSVSGQEAGTPSGTLPQGQRFGLRGVISSNYVINHVEAHIFDTSGKDVEEAPAYYKDWNKASYNIQSDGINNHFSFASLTPGSYRYVVAASDTSANIMRILIDSWFAIDAPTTYTISYNANGGTGAPPNQTKTHGTNLTLSSTKPNRANSSAGSFTVTLNANGGSVSSTSLTAARTTSYSFKNWNTAANGSGTSYNAGANYTANAAATLYAQWNSSTSTAAVTLLTPTRNGYTFVGWGTSSSASSGVTGSYTPSSNVTLYAVWTPVRYTITYDSNGGSACPTQTVRLEEELTIPSSTKTGYRLEGWLAKRTIGSTETWHVKDQGWHTESELLSGNLTKEIYAVGRMPTFGTGWTDGNTGARFTFYAVWTPNVLEVKYQANGGVSNSSAFSVAPSGMIQQNGADIVEKWAYDYASETGLYNASTFGLARDGYTFMGWSRSSDGSTDVFDQDDTTLKAQQIYPALANGDASVILYAVWRQNGVVIDTQAFPDASFRSYISNSFDTNGDVFLSESEIAGITYIDCHGMSISDLSGIEYLTALTTLNCSNNRLTSLNINNNKALIWLDCSFNRLRSLDVSRNTTLTTLHCNSNQLTGIDVSANTALTEFWCDNNQLTDVNVENNTALTMLYCFSNQLTNLELSKNTALMSLDCSYNELTSLNISNNTALMILYCGGNELTFLDVSQNRALSGLYCGENQLRSLDVSNNTELKDFWCFSNQLTSLNVSSNIRLREFGCTDNQLTSLDISQNTALTLLHYDGDCLIVAANASNQFDLGILYAFDVSKATDWQGGTVEGSTLTFSAEEVTCTYNAGNSGGDNKTLTLRMASHETTITYDANGGVGAPAQQQKMDFHDLQLAEAIPTRAEYYFLGWALDQNATRPDYQPGGTFTGNEDTTLYAVWAQPDFKLPNALTMIEKEAFECSAFRFVSVPLTAASIENRAFADCPNMTAILIASDTVVIDRNAFEGTGLLVIFGHEGSTAETFANTFDYLFRKI